MASPPFSISETTPGDSDLVAAFPTDERDFRDIVESWLTIHSDPASGYVKIPVDTTSNLNGLSPQPANGGLRYDTTTGRLQVKVSGSWVNVGEFPAGTRMLFQQTSAPTGWTKITDAAYEDAVLFLTTGSVGTSGTVGSSAFLINADNFEDAIALCGGTTNSDGAHTHAPGAGTAFVATGGDNAGGVDIGDGGTDISTNSVTASGGSHTHDFVAFTASAENSLFTEVKGVSFILCQKD